jgi:hypothetical protein
MNEATQDVSDVAVDTTPVPNEAPTQDTPEKEVEASTEETEQGSPEVEEKSVEDQLAELKKQNESLLRSNKRKTAAQHAAQRAHEKMLQENREYQLKLEKLEGNNTDKEPSIDQFETHDDYLNAVREYERTNAEKNALEKFQQQQAEQKQQEIQAHRAQIVSKQEAEFMEVNPDYVEAKNEFSQFVASIKVDTAVENAITEQTFEGNVPQLIEYFGRNGGENLDRLVEISQLSPARAAVEIYKIQQTLKAPEKKQVKPAPAPVTKPKGGGKPRKNLEDGDVLKNLGLK